MEFEQSIMHTIAFLSMDDLTGYICDDDLVIPPLQNLGWNVETISWHDPSAQWDRYKGVVIRSSWDYQRALPTFLETLHTIHHKSLLANSLDTVKWNADKGYLRELEHKGVKIVPTLWGENSFNQTDLESWRKALSDDELVIKPNVSAGAEDTFRISPGCPLPFDPVGLFAGRRFMVQPFQRSIVDEGEYSLFYFAGAYSHTILKTPASGDFRVQEEHAGEVRSADPPATLPDAGASVLSLLDEMPLYARVDYVRDRSGEFALMELELIEPSLYIRMDDGAAARFAGAIDAHFRSC